MGQYSITAGTFGKALAVTPVAIGNIDPRSAWEFENQSGTLGNNYTGSQLYVGGTGNVDVILAGVTGAQDTVTGLNLQAIFTGANPSYSGFTAGTGYTTGTNIATTAVSLVHKSPANQPAGLTVDITANLMADVGTPGLGYTDGAFTTSVAVAGIIGVNAGTGAIETVIITNLGTAGPGDTFDILGRAGNGAGSITIQSLGEVTAVTIGNAAGTNYSVGDIITVSGGTIGNIDCKFAIASVESLLPGANDVVRFTAVPVGTILPAAVSYVISTGDATGLVALK